MKRIVVFTGAGVSADSGISTFRDSDGLWENYRVEEICTPQALAADREKVLSFYDQRRKGVMEAKPNAGHVAIAKLEQYYDVRVVTQNIDDLHERAGSTHVTHLHGEIMKLRSSINELATVPIEGWKQPRDARHPDGSLLRPFIVFFNEAVPMIEPAMELMQTADIVLIIGTSLQVYPAAGLSMYAPRNAEMYLIDPKPNTAGFNRPIHVIAKGASEGMKEFMEIMNSKC